jgi:hypothetical protein
LLIDPIRPYLAPEGPFAARRAAELAERQRRNAPHRSILVRWGIGAITMDGDTATAVTQETWSNQEASAVAPEQATVRVDLYVGLGCRGGAMADCRDQPDASVIR